MTQMHQNSLRDKPKYEEKRNLEKAYGEGESGEGEKPFGNYEGERLLVQSRKAVLCLVVVGGAEDI